MPRTLKKPTEMSVHDLTMHGREMTSYHMGDRWCPAVIHKGDGYSVRFGRRTSNGWSFDYFRTDANGLIVESPRGYARDYNRRVRLTDVAAVAESLTEPDSSAVRFTFGPF